MTAPLRNYEIGIVFHPQTPREDIETLRDRIVTGIPRLTNGVGEVFRIDEWGLRRLAYKINKQSEGIYIYMYSHMPSDVVHEVERLLNLTESVVRYLVILAEPPSEEVIAAPTDAVEEDAAEESDDEVDDEEETEDDEVTDDSDEE